RLSEEHDLASSTPEGELCTVSVVLNRHMPHGFSSPPAVWQRPADPNRVLSRPFRSCTRAKNPPPGLSLFCADLADQLRDHLCLLQRPRAASTEIACRVCPRPNRLHLGRSRRAPRAASQI